MAAGNKMGRQEPRTHIKHQSTTSSTSASLRELGHKHVVRCLRRWLGASSSPQSVFLLILLLLVVLGGAEARTGPWLVHRKVAPRRALSTIECVDGYPAAGNGTDVFQKTWSVHRKVAEKVKLPKNVLEGIDFDVDNFGAAGDGQSDGTNAFQKAWTKACSSAQPAALLIPAGKTYLLNETVLVGPCKSQVTVKLDGTLVAPQNKSDWSKQGHPHWLRFNSVDNLTVTGKDTLDGNGEVWWKNSCRRNPKLPCTFAPAALTFSSCSHLKVENIKLVNASHIHLWVEYFNNMRLSHLTITALGNSPKNDGIHISHSDDVHIIKAAIKVGDDYTSIAMDTTNLYASNIEFCPGHGISIGTLGNGNSKAHVSNITIDGAHLSSTMFGARIKTWQGGSGYAKDIKFLNMVMDNVKTPIIVDQNYCTMADPSKPKPCEQQKSAMQLSNILFKNISGTSAKKEAIKLHYSKAFPCHDIVLQDIDLKMKGGGDKNAMTSTCENAKLSKSSNVSPQPCMSKVTKDDWVSQEQD